MPRDRGAEPCRTSNPPPRKSPRAPKPYVIYITDRTELGAIIRLVPKGYLRQRTTMTAGRAERFRTKAEATRYLKAEVRRDGRHSYMVGKL